MNDLQNLLREFESRTGLRGLEFEIKERPGGDVMIIYVANPTERMFSILEDIRREYAEDAEDLPLITIQKRSKRNLLLSAEGKMLLRTLSESLNINRHSFKDDFFSRYTKSVSGAEEQIVASANHVVFGRRGAGKSSLLLYALHTREREDLPSLWVDMQTYSRRSDREVTVDILLELVNQFCLLRHIGPDPPELKRSLVNLKDDPGNEYEAISQVLPDVRRFFSDYTTGGKNVAVFLDDIHVLQEELQASLLGDLYSIFRGNNVFLKISAIETLTKTWNSETRHGLQIGHDLQTITLDYNLTIPDKATAHISSILDAHARYCGLPSIRNLCTSNDVLSRLVWVAAGVPRDAANLFAKAMTKVTLEGRRHVSVSGVNVAASETIPQKLRDLENDASGSQGQLTVLLDRIKEFVLRDSRKNAFLLEITTGDTFDLVQKLVDLRVLHVISEGISIGEAGRKHLGLILDYGFYTGIRAARSVDLFNQQTTRVTYRDLRRLPVLPYSRLIG